MKIIFPLKISREFRLTMPGLFNVENALAAAAVLLAWFCRFEDGRADA